MVIAHPQDKATGLIATNAFFMHYARNIFCRECLDPSALKNLDSNIKKNTAFIKKCKTGLTADVSTQLLNDIKKLSLEKYISEIVAAILEGLLRCKLSADVAAAIEVCFLAQYYVMNLNVYTDLMWISN